MSHIGEALWVYVVLVENLIKLCVQNEDKNANNKSITQKIIKY